MRASLMLVAAALLFAASAALAAQDDKVDICHVPPGDPSAAHVITVGATAVPAHVAHGDPEPNDAECQCACVVYVQCLSACDDEDPECAEACREPLPPHCKCDLS